MKKGRLTRFLDLVSTCPQNLERGRTELQRWVSHLPGQASSRRLQGDIAPVRGKRRRGSKSAGFGRRLMRKNGSGVLSENLVPLTPAKRVIVGLLERDAGLAATRAVSKHHRIRSAYTENMIILDRAAPPSLVFPEMLSPYSRGPRGLGRVGTYDAILICISRSYPPIQRSRYPRTPLRFPQQENKHPGRRGRQDKPVPRQGSPTQLSTRTARYEIA